MTNIIVANWKMNKNREQARTFCDRIHQDTFPNEVIIAPALPFISALTRDYGTNINFCSQDVSGICETYGAYTGEVSAAVLESLGVKYAIVGHYERRKYLGETNALIKTKAEFCLKHSITPIICLGEKEDSRNKGKHLEKIASDLSDLLPKTYSSLIIAYEPVWAIGSGNLPKLSEIAEVADYVLDFINKNSNIKKNVKVIYGGSVNQDNAADILSLKSISGLLIGSKSLEIDEFKKICMI